MESNMTQDEVNDLLRQHIKDNYPMVKLFMAKHGVSRQTLCNIMAKRQYPTESILHELGLVKIVSISFSKRKLDF